MGVGKEIDRYYIIPAFKPGQHSHLAYVETDPLACWEFAYTVCLPCMPVMARDPCENAHLVVERAHLDEWDKYGHEVTCPTCLKRARGE